MSHTRLRVATGRVLTRRHDKTANTWQPYQGDHARACARGHLPNQISRWQTTHPSGSDDQGPDGNTLPEAGARQRTKTVKKVKCGGTLALPQRPPWDLAVEAAAVSYPLPTGMLDLRLVPPQDPEAAAATVHHSCLRTQIQARTTLTTTHPSECHATGARSSHRYCVKGVRHITCANTTGSISSIADPASS